MPLATTTADASGRTVLAARRLNTAAKPAGAIDGMITTGHHIILLPKLAPSCSVKISAAVTNAPAAARPARLRSNRPVRMSVTARVPMPNGTLLADLDRFGTSVALGAGKELLGLLADAGFED